MLKGFRNCYQLIFYFAFSALLSFDTFGINLELKNSYPSIGFYKSSWKKVDSLLMKRLPKSALEIVHPIYTQAKQENNWCEIVKSIMYRLRLHQQVEGDNGSAIFNEMDEELKNSSYPLTPILHSVLADLYQSYYNQNRNKFLDRSKVVKMQQDNMSTWDVSMIFDLILKHHLLALENTDSLKRTPLNIYDEIILQGTPDAKGLRPTLYDFIAHRALDFFMNEEPDIIRPAFKFEINDERCFGNIPEFVRMKFETKDTLSGKFFACRLFQDLLTFHSNDADPSGLIDLNLKRLQFFKKHAKTGINDSLYLSAISLFENQYRKCPISTEVSYELAKLLTEKGRKYDPRKSDDNKWYIKKALAVCDSAINRFPMAAGSINCEILEAGLKVKSFSFVIEEANLIDKPFKGYLTYKNVKKIYVRVVPVDYDKYVQSGVQNYKGIYLGKNDEKVLKDFLSIKPLKEWSIDLLDDGDFQTHYLEFFIPPLSAGYYVYLISESPTFELYKNGIAYETGWVTNLGFINRKIPDGGYELFVFDRETGFPIKDVEVSLWYPEMQKDESYSYRKYDDFKGSVNEHCIIHPIFSNKDIGLFQVQLKKGNDRYQFKPGLWLEDFRGLSSESPESTETALFTDRGIYRPGQTIYFKGIVMKKKDDKYVVLPNFEDKISFYDANGQLLVTQDLKTDEFGSYSGTFVAPRGMLNGQMHIKTFAKSIWISVEEYKRPKFEVKLQPIQGIHKTGDQISVFGKVKAFAGSNIVSAQVKYRVVRNASFSNSYWYRHGYYPESPSIEIVNGETLSNDTGGFTIPFLSLSDAGVSKDANPTYTYTIYADVTDINGETHSDQKTVITSQACSVLKIPISNLINRQDSVKFALLTTNTNGSFVPGKVRVKVFKLVEPQRVFRERMWDKPDRFLLSERKYHAIFPNDIYDDENNTYKWAKGRLVYDNVFNSEFKKEVEFTDMKNWELGTYFLEASMKDSCHQLVNFEKYFTIYSEKGGEFPGNKVDWFTMVKDHGEPGDKAVFLIGSKEKVKVLYELEEKGMIVQQYWLGLDRNQYRIEVPIEEKNRGGFGIHLTFVKDNRIYEHDQLIGVPWSNKQLELQLETFRDKLLPGQEEQWRFKIKNQNGLVKGTEMLATMVDASLDKLRKNDWQFDLYSNYWLTKSWEYDAIQSPIISNLFNNYWNPSNNLVAPRRSFSSLNWFGYYPNLDILSNQAQREYSVASSSVDMSGYQGGKAIKNKVAAYNMPLVDEIANPNPPEPPSLINDLSQVSLRTNFDETAFFYPNLLPDENGFINLKFKVPESLTRWKMMGLVFTKDLKYGQIRRELVTQKSLMVVPNSPRFFREKDHVRLSVKIINLAASPVEGKVELHLFDGISMKPLFIFDSVCLTQQPFLIRQGFSDTVNWSFTIPDDVETIKYRVVAQTDSFSDGEEMIVPVLSDRMLVTESMPLSVRAFQKKEFTFKNFISQNNASTTLRNHRLTLEFTANPAWYAIQALPYLMEYPYECSEQLFSRFYANSLATHIANSSAKIKSVFNNWKDSSAGAFVSNLEKNQELKSLMLEETPWVLEAKNESERKNKVALLFDLNHMSSELSLSLNKLRNLQQKNGSWPWFHGMGDDPFVTQHIISGLGHLDHLGVRNVRNDPAVWQMVKSGIVYMDAYMKQCYDQLVNECKTRKNNIECLANNNLGCFQIQYLYARSFFQDIKVDATNKVAFDYFKRQAQLYGLSVGIYQQGMLALALNRYGDKVIPREILKSLKENAMNSEELGMYWKSNYAGYYWWEAPIETQALMIEAFEEILNDSTTVDALKTWLLKSKQTQNWKSTKATTEACYALLLHGTDWLSTVSKFEIKLGNLMIDPSKFDQGKQETGTGYYKTSWADSTINPQFGKVTISKKDPGVSWGALNWQYFEQLDKIPASKTPLNIDKQLFVEHNTPSGPVIEPIKSNTVLKIGDKVVVRIELRVDRDMQYVQMKDMRAACLEPLNVISQYKFQDGLGYYESTRDASTNFFFSALHKGTYVFEYPLRVSQSGEFSNGITSIECVYAPEFRSNSAGVRIVVRK